MGDCLRTGKTAIQVKSAYYTVVYTPWEDEASGLSSNKQRRWMQTCQQFKTKKRNHSQWSPKGRQ